MYTYKNVERVDREGESLIQQANLALGLDS